MSTPTPAAAIPVEARQAAARLAELFDSDQQLAKRQNEALARLRAANDELWSGLHPDALGQLYDNAGASAEQATSRITATIADARAGGADEHGVETAVLQAVQEIHWRIHRASHDYQEASEDRRHLAADVGEQTTQLVAALVVVGWTEEQARGADVRQLAAATAGR